MLRQHPYHSNKENGLHIPQKFKSSYTNISLPQHLNDIKLGQHCITGNDSKSANIRLTSIPGLALTNKSVRILIWVPEPHSNNVLNPVDLVGH